MWTTFHSDYTDELHEYLGRIRAGEIEEIDLSGLGSDWHRQCDTSCNTCVKKRLFSALKERADLEPAERSNVTLLNLTGCDVSSADLKQLLDTSHGLTSLLVITLDHCKLDKKCVDNLMTGMMQAYKQSTVQKLELKNCSLSSASVDLLTDLLHKSIEHLTLAQNMMDTECSIQVFRRLVSYDKLRYLDLSDNILSDDVAESLGQLLEGARGLEELYLDRCGLGLRCTSTLGKSLINSNTLKRLHISGNNLSNKGVANIADAFTPSVYQDPVRPTDASTRRPRLNSTVTDLNLSWNRIGLEGAKKIGECFTVKVVSGTAYHNALDTLCLYGNAITCDSTESLCRHIGGHLTLKVLDLGNNSIGNVGMTHISKMLCENKTLTSLSLRSNCIKAPGCRPLVTALTANKTLTSLDLTDNCITLFDPSKSMAEVAMDALSSMRSGDMQRRKRRRKHKKRYHRYRVHKEKKRMTASEKAARQHEKKEDQKGAKHIADWILSIRPGDTAVKEILLTNNPINDEGKWALEYALMASAAGSEMHLGMEETVPGAEGLEESFSALNTYPSSSDESSSCSSCSSCGDSASSSSDSD
eukprot:GFYU01031104.1.p1 GENE.GFYU01031104.1~~GFYU01031104.1.p1  ORF type:complete len:586 (-),score=154.00 GFYU01031104.1:142-1899(-)